jgi:MoxR-like ATPase
MPATTKPNPLMSAPTTTAGDLEAIAGEYNVTCAHVRDVAPLVLRHRVMTNFHAEAEGVTPDKIVGLLLQHVGEPRAEDYR